MTKITLIALCYILALLTLAGADSGDRESLLSKANLYGERTLETETTFAVENALPPQSYGTWQFCDWSGNGQNDLVFIQTSNTGTNSVEVHIASAASNYSKRVLETGSNFTMETDGTWLLAPNPNIGKPDLVFIKTANTPSGKVEVHMASAESQYQTRTLETVTDFDCETDGTWLLYDYTGSGQNDLVFIKTSNSDTATVEVHVASAASKYKTRIFEKGTIFSQVDATTGTWLLAPYKTTISPDLVFIKTANTAGKVEVYVASAESSYQTKLLDGVQTTFARENDGVWTLAGLGQNDALPLLAFIKTANTPSGNVEVHFAH